MDVIVSCPACRFSVSVPEDDVLTTKVTCPRCRHVFEPSGPDVPAPPPLPAPSPSYPKVPAYTAPADGSRRSRARRRSAAPVAPANAAPVRPRARFWPWAVAAAAVVGVLFGLLTVIVLRVRGTSGPQTYSPDDSFQITFPGRAEWVNEPVADANGKKALGMTIRLFKGRGPRDGWEYAVRLTEPTQNRGLTDENDAAADVNECAAQVLDGHSEKATPVTETGYPAAQAVVRVPTRKMTYVIRGIILNDRAYLLIVSGRGATPDAPHVQEFFASFRHAWIGPPDPDYQAPTGEAFQPLARLPRWGGATFTPDGRHLYTNEWHGAGARAVRYEFPSFRKISSFPTASGGKLLLDEPGRRLYEVFADRGTVAGGEFVTTISRYDLPPGGIDQPVKQLKIYGLRDSYLGAVPCGEYLFVLTRAREPNDDFLPTARDATLSRIDPDTMTVDRRLRVPRATGGLTAAPDGSAVHVVADGATVPVTVWDVDPERFEVRHRLPVAAPVHHIHRTPAGQLFCWAPGRHTRVLDLTAPDHPRRLAARNETAPLVTDGRRLISSVRTLKPEPSLQLWDVGSELKALRPAHLGSLDASGNELLLAPDSRALLLGDGRVYWLAGAGPKPEVDPAAGWKP